MLSPDIGQFDPIPALTLWWNSGERSKRPAERKGKEGSKLKNLTETTGYDSEDVPEAEAADNQIDAERPEDSCRSDFNIERDSSEDDYSDDESDVELLLKDM